LAASLGSNLTFGRKSLLNTIVIIVNLSKRTQVVVVVMILIVAVMLLSAMKLFRKRCSRFEW
jgi:hypothetical protein